MPTVALTVAEGKTDLGRLCALLDEWGVPYDRNAKIHYHPVPHDKRTDWSSDGAWTPEDVVSIVVAEASAYAYPRGNGARVPPSDKVDGYQGFYTEYEFTPAGKFLRMGAWE